ncbi:MAG: cation diffusion facilitator family transporter [Candidatus Lokiarchaeota archaeon]|nr:cation diffusion facilitator family transporter [Candidatus Lokiarchaeota archaeon]
MVAERKEKDEFYRGERVAILSVFLMIFLTVLKGSAGLFYNSVALLADAINSFADILASALIWSGLRLASKEADEKFPYGYFRGETLASLAVGTMVLITGGQIILEGVRGLIEPSQISDGFIPLLAAAISSIIYFILSKYKRKVGEEIGSQGLIADSTHSMLDVYSGLIVFIGISFSILGFPLAEIVVALIIGIYIIKEGLELAKDAIMSLMDANVNPELAKEIQTLTEADDEVLDAHDVKVRRSGPVQFVEMHIIVDRDLHVESAFKIMSEIEEKISEKYPTIESITVRIEPGENIPNYVAIPVDSDGTDSQYMFEHFGKAPFFALCEIYEDRCETRFIENPGYAVEKQRGQLAVDALVKHNVKAVIVGEIGMGPLGLLRGFSIMVYKINEEIKDFRTVLKKFQEGELERIGA